MADLNTNLTLFLMAITNGYVQMTATPFASLPATPVAGMMAYVTNCSTQVWGAAADGAGAFKVQVWYNGTGWTVVGK